MPELKTSCNFLQKHTIKRVIFSLFFQFFSFLFVFSSFVAFFGRFLSFFQPPPPFSAQKQGCLKTPHTKPPPFLAQNQASLKTSISAQKETSNTIRCPMFPGGEKNFIN